MTKGDFPLKYEGRERVRGIEPPYAAWEAAVLPLNYTRVLSRLCAALGWSQLLPGNHVVVGIPRVLVAGAAFPIAA